MSLINASSAEYYGLHAQALQEVSLGAESHSGWRVTAETAQRANQIPFRVCFEWRYRWLVWRDVTLDIEVCYRLLHLLTQVLNGLGGVHTW